MLAKCVDNLKSFIVMDILEMASKLEQQGEHIVHLEIGEPDFPLPSAVKKAIEKGLKENHTHYTHSQGILELREAICAYYQQKYQVQLNPDQIFVTQGTSPALLLALALILNPQEEVILTDPCYACYPNFIHLRQGIPRYLPIFEEEDYQLDISRLKKMLTPKTKALLLNSPANPTGKLLSAQNLKELAELSQERNLLLISDEIYHGLVYTGKEHSLLEFTPRAFILNGFSKLFAMTGLRLGYLIVPEDFILPLRKMAQNFFICANSLAQLAGIAALKEAWPEVKQMVATFAQRRTHLLQGLQELGFEIPSPPEGAFYVFVKAKHLTKHFENSSLNLAKDILLKARVGVTPGIDFGARGEGFLRFSYATSLENITLGLERLKKYLQKF
ncbi:MAG: (5-formylfuran-3-yl)methyl phosphate transaminase [Desulfonauticus sp.]|jgi:aspartate/methionine/tyrosine aminotransferase|nr:MAG: Aspartate aminotransferase [Desulfonauticus sp. 38_4375]MDK2922121.1 (5-formylfuran-3-yl)methyl phosphate transaminase [Desulfonauticus sp.]